ncbi:MAG TPA: 16S rRNA pseudouridine(516) synthase [Sulfurovum sp. UBA12169]|nr:MAG TPA: 16S rRNA pseudouridine(516) synthase [Sulfurovum sp. UBA12169]
MELDLDRLDKILTSLGYGSRKEVQHLIKNGQVAVCGMVSKDVKQKVYHADVTIDGEPLDPQTLIVVLYKPMKYVCSHNDAGRLIYSLLPPRWQKRNPKISTIGRLDGDTTGVILLTDDGALNHALTSPKKHVAKLYEVTLASPVRGDEVDIFSSGTLMLHGDDKPCMSAKLTIIDSYNATVELTEGRYHQVKRMFAAVGNKVVRLHRKQFANIEIGDLQEGQYKIICKEDILF